MPSEKKKDHKPVKNILISVGAVLIFVLAAFSFLFLPAIAPSEGDKLPPFGKYNRKPIEWVANSYFANMVSYYADQQTTEQGGSSDFTIFQKAFTAAVLRIAFTEEVDKSGYIPPARLINRTVLPAFYDSNGVYSQRLFNAAPESTKLQLREEAVGNLKHQLYYNDVFGNGDTDYPMYGLKRSSAENSFIFNLGKNERSFEVASFSLSNYPQDEIVSFGSGHSDLFVKYDLAALTVDSENEAKKLLSQLNRNELVFEDAVTEYSSRSYTDTEGRVLGAYYYNLRDTISNAEQLTSVLTLGPGQLSGVVSTGESWSIFRGGESGPVQPDFENAGVIDSVKVYMTSNEAGLIEDYFLNRARDFASAAVISGFDAACTEFGIPKNTTGFFPLNYGNNQLLSPMDSSVTALAGAQNSDLFLKTAFSLRINEISSPILLNDNVIVLRFVDERETETFTEDLLQMWYPMYAESFNQSAVQNYFFGNGKLENNLIDVYLKYFLVSR
jgi:hypothetical protein